MTTSNDPDEIRAEIEYTRAALSDDVDALADTANPKKIAQRQVDKAKDAVVGVKDRVMGTADDVADSAQSLILEQVASGVFVRMAVLAELLADSGSAIPA